MLVGSVIFVVAVNVVQWKKLWKGSQESSILITHTHTHISMPEEVPCTASEFISTTFATRGIFQMSQRSWSYILWKRKGYKILTPWDSVKGLSCTTSGERENASLSESIG